jgi:hypothetical protein
MPLDFTSSSSNSDIISGQGSGGGPTINNPRMKAGSGSTQTTSSGNNMSSRIHNFNKNNKNTSSNKINRNVENLRSELTVMFHF